MAARFSAWLEEGHRALPARTRSPAEFRSFRFWARGPGRDGLVVGVVRDSSDSIGRPFPLCTMGAGTLAAWEEHWDRLPLACAPCWDRMDYLAGGTMPDVRRMEVEVAHRLPPPLPEWERFTELPAPAGAADGARLDREAGPAAMPPGDTAVFVRLDTVRDPDPVVAAARGCAGLRRGGTPAPTAVFLGGDLATAWLAVFCRALVPADFVRLWTTPGVGGGAGT
jgi:type VI secretion system protein VasJ